MEHPYLFEMFVVHEKLMDEPSRGSWFYAADHEGRDEGAKEQENCQHDLLLHQEETTKLFRIGSHINVNHKIHGS